MSMIVVENKSIVTVNGSVRKMITGVNVAGIIRSILPPELLESDIIRTRNIKLSYEMAHNAVTGHKSPIAFVQGFAFCVTAFSHGNKNLTQLSENAPEWTRFALEHACAMFKAGAGNITAESLIVAVDSAVKAVLACPAPESKKVIKSTSTAVVVDSTSTRVDDESIDAEKVNRQADKSDEKAADNLASATAEHAEKIAAENKAAAEKAAAEKASQEDVDIVRIVQAFAINRPEFALQQLQDAAALLGYRLSKIPAKKLAQEKAA